MNDIPGPAVDIPEYLAALMLLQIRGCLVTWRPPALEVYEVGYPSGPDTVRIRLFYADHRGTQQALQLLRELNNEAPWSPTGLSRVVHTGCEV